MVFLSMAGRDPGYTWLNAAWWGNARQRSLAIFRGSALED